MKIIICAKQVPDTNEVRIDPVNNNLLRDSAPSIMNPDDTYALEEALIIKDKIPGTHITVISMGPAQAKDMLEECLALGADEAVLISDKALIGSDTWVTSNVLAAAIKKIGSYDLILTGRQAIDGDTAQVGPQLAEKLGLPQATYVQELAVAENTFIVKRALEDGFERIKVKKPCLLTIIKGSNEPRHMTVQGIYEVKNKDIKSWSIQDLNIDPSEVGLEASHTKVIETYLHKVKGKGLLIEADTVHEKVAILMEKLNEKLI